MAKEYESLHVVPDDIKSYKAVHAAKMVLTRVRTGVDKRRKELGVDAYAWIKTKDGAAKDLLEPIIPLEDRFKEEMAAEDARIEKIEADRVQAIRNKIDGIRAFYYTVDKTAKEIEIIYQDLLKYDPISEDNFQEFTHEAISVYNDTLAALITGKEIRLKFELEEADRKAEAERLAKQKAEQEAEAARLKAIADEQEEEKKKIQAEKDKIEVAQKKILADFAEAEKQKDRAAFEKQALLDARIKAEEDAEEQAKRKESARIAKAEAEKAEHIRKAARAPDKVKLIKWVESFNETNNPSPSLKSKEANAILQIAKDEIEITLQEAMSEAENL